MVIDKQVGWKEPFSEHVPLDGVPQVPAREVEVVFVQMLAVVALDGNTNVAVKDGLLGHGCPASSPVSQL
jgi:hypothetical protein